MRPFASASSLLGSTFALLAPEQSPAGPVSRRAAGHQASPDRSSLTVYVGFPKERLPAHERRRPEPCLVPVPTAFRVTSHLELFSAGKLWADACVEWPHLPRSEVEARSRIREANELRARLHRECLLAWLNDSEQIIQAGESIERVHFGTVLRAAAISNGVEDLIGQRVKPTFSVLCRAQWAIWSKFPFKMHARYMFHRESAGAIFTYNDVDFGLTHGFAIAWWKPGDRLPPVSDQ